MIKIISGEFKGRMLKAPKGIRPILAQVKKSIFDILSPYLEDCLFLDLYAGSGAVGIEAISRGAKFCVFVEKEKHCLKVLSENITTLNCQNKCYIIKADVLKDLFWVEKAKQVLNKNFNREVFDIIFIGAPYITKNKKPANFCNSTLDIIVNSTILAKDGIIVVQHSKKENVCFNKLILKRTEHYGDTTVSFFKRL